MNFGSNSSHYRFTGRIIPEAAFASRLKSLRKLESTFLSGYYSYSLINSHFIFDVISEVKINFEDALSAARMIISSDSAQIAFQICAHYIVCFDEYVNMNTAEFGRVSAAEPFHGSNKNKYLFKRKEDFAQLEAFPPDFRLNQALKLATLAVAMPFESPILCRMSIEFIATRIAEDKQLDRKRKWDCLKKELYLSNDTLTSFKNISADIRHGEIKEIPWSERSEILEITWEIVYRYKLYINGELNELNPMII